MLRHSELIPDECALVGRKVFKDGGRFEITAPAGSTHYRVSTNAVGGQGQDPGGNGAFAHTKGKAAAGEVFEVQVGTPGTGGALGDSWFRRKVGPVTLCYADRGRGTGSVQGNAALCIGDLKRSGVANVGSGADAGDVGRLGLGGRPGGADGRRAPGPGGGGRGVPFGSPPSETQIPAGQGLVKVEFYSGDPGLGY